MESSTLPDGCWLSIEAAGPAGRTTQSVMIVPDTLRAMAAWLVQQCVAAAHGIGGFITLSFASMINYVDRPSLPPVPYPTSTTFITLTISGINGKRFWPGDTDPSIPIVFAEYTNARGGRSTEASHIQGISSVLADYWLAVAVVMERGGPKRWWGLQPSQTSNEMTYVCDTGLGRPSVTDCTQIEWNQLGPASISPPSDTVAVGPGVVQFLHSSK